MKRDIILWILGILLVIAGFSEPMILIFPMGIFVYLCKEKIKLLTDKLPLIISFIGAGVFFGLLTESFAILDNLAKPVNERILLSGDPLKDILYGTGYYVIFVIAWYFLLKKVRFSKKEIFFLSGLYGVLAEQSGQVFFNVFLFPGFGLLYAFIIVFVYGIFPFLAYMLNEHRFNSSKFIGRVKYLIVVIVFFAQWAIYGNLVLPLLKRVVE